MKTGILTHFFNTMNYGGALQAYALPTALKKMGYEAEQISYLFWQFRELSKNMVFDYDAVSEYPPVGSSVSGFGKAASEEIIKRHERIEEEFMTKRRAAFSKFRNNIPHSEKIYSANTIFMANEEYDTFIVGSDQVWNMTLQSAGFFLEFADDNKKKIAYSASSGSAEFDEVQIKYLKRVLPKFDSISVREKDLAEVLRSVVGVKVEHTLDSVLLLDREDWDDIASERLIHEKYLFCFSYDPTEKMYAVAKQYAEKHGLKVAIIPYALSNDSVILDDNFGDYRMGAASPADFLSLIKYADCIITDSFHAVVYSLLYRHQVYVFKRDTLNNELKSDMSARIYTLLDIFGRRDHFCDSPDKISLEYIETVDDIDYSRENVELNKLKEASMAYLKKNLGIAP